MIRNISLRNWRAYRLLDLELDTGTTFIVAGNGIGKTSIISAIQWCIFGDLSGVDPWLEARRDEEGTTRVVVELVLPELGLLRIEREAVSARRRTLSSTIDDQPIHSEADLQGLLAEAFRADASVLSRLSVLPEGGIDELITHSDLLQRHLAVVFGLDNLDSAADSAEAAAREARARIKELESFASVEEEIARESEVDLSSIELALRDADAEMDALSTALAREKQEHDLAKSWAAFDQMSAQVAEKRLVIAQLLAERYGGDGNPSDVESTLAQAEQAVNEENDEQRAQIAEIGAHEALLRDHISHLDDSDCPICLRALDAVTEHRARTEHMERLSQLSERRSALELDTSRVVRTIAELRALRSELAQHAQPQVPAGSRPTSTETELGGSLTAITQQVESAAARVAVLRNDLRIQRGRNERAESSTKARDALIGAHRSELIANAAAEALRNTSKEIVERNVTPLESALRDRWKALMSNRGSLMFRRGRPVLTHGSRELDLRQASGGERAVATMLTRLLVLRGATRSRFVVFDEPLEHLDPAHRRSIAATLINATRSGDFDQVLVTTYEEAVVRRLAENATNARVLYVNDA